MAQPVPNAIIGGLPTNKVDTPISAVFIVLFAGLAVTHMTIFQRNRKRGHHFIFSGLLFGFSMARIVANIMRIVWANRPRNSDVALAANIFTGAGVVLLYVVNVLFTKRMVRGQHPWLINSHAYDMVFKILVALIAAVIFSLIGILIASLKTHDLVRLERFRRYQLFASTFFTVMAFLPLPVLLLSTLNSKRRGHSIAKFGSGSWRMKVLLLVSTAILLTVGVVFKTVVAYKPRPATHPAWYHSKFCFYFFNFVLEFLVSLMYAVSRFDKRFHYVKNAAVPTEVRGVAGDEGMQLRELQGSHGLSEEQTQFAVK